MKKTTIAMILASAMMLSLLGCSMPASTEEAPVKEEAVAEDVKEPATESEAIVKTETVEKPEETAASTDTKPEEASDNGSSAAIKYDPDGVDELEGDSFLYDGNIISILNNAQSVLDGLGATNKVDTQMTGVNCYNNGKDDINVYTREINGEEVVTQISISDASVSTTRQIKVGSSEEDVRKAYGEPIDETVEGNTLLTYDGDGYTIMFAIANDVKAITYFKKLQ